MRKPIPIWEPLSPEWRADPRATYDRMRAQCPMTQSLRGVTLLRHADVVAAAHNPTVFSSTVSLRRAVPNSMDVPEHTAWRALIDTFFTPQQVAAQEPRVRAVAQQLLAELPRGVAIDAVAAIGKPFAVYAQTQWLGWQGAEDDLLAWMADNHAATRSAERTQTEAAAVAFDALIRTQLNRRRQLGHLAPSDPTTALLAATHQDGQALADEDIVSILRNWTAGDLGSMAAALGVVIWYLATHADLQQALRAAPQDLPAAIDEILRIDDPFLVNRRRTTGAVALHDHVLPEQTVVYLNWTSANRDEAVFGNPDDFRPAHNAPHNLVWGTGIHVCPGRPLASMELAVATQALLAATTRIAPSPDALPVRESYPLGGWQQAPVVLSGTLFVGAACV